MNRDLGIETLRTAAMFWIVLAHVAGISPGSGLGYSETPTMQYTMQTFGFFPVPMFVMISGYLYAVKPVPSGGYGSFALHMVRSLLLPAIGVGVLFYSAKFFTGQTHGTFLGGLIEPLLYPNNHLWFLYALLWAYLIAGALDVMGALASATRWALIAAAVVITELNTTVPTTLLAVNKVPYTLGFFLLGYGFNRYQDVFWPKRTRWLLISIGIALVVYNQWTWFSGQRMEPEAFKVFERSMSWVLLPLIMLYRKPVKYLAALGPLTFVIYLFHPFGAVVGRTLLYRYTDIDTPIVLFTLCYVFCVVTSLLAYSLGGSALRWVRHSLHSIRHRQYN